MQRSLWPNCWVQLNATFTLAELLSSCLFSKISSVFGGHDILLSGVTGCGNKSSYRNKINMVGHSIQMYTVNYSHTLCAFYEVSERGALQRPQKLTRDGLLWISADCLHVVLRRPYAANGALKSMNWLVYIKIQKCIFTYESAVP